MIFLALVIGAFYGLVIGHFILRGEIAQCDALIDALHAALIDRDNEVRRMTRKRDARGRYAPRT